MSSISKLLFLDFDGVLHPSSSSRDEHFICLPRFENVLRGFVDACVVISSTWRYFYSLDQLRSNFSPDIQPRVVGVTPLLEDHTPATRYKEIDLYLVRLSPPPVAWIAIDDSGVGYPDGFRNLLLCDPRVGFDRLAATKRAAWLEEDVPNGG